MFINPRNVSNTFLQEPLRHSSNLTEMPVEAENVKSKTEYYNAWSEWERNALRGMVNRGKWRFQGYEIAWTDKPMS